MWVCPQQKSSPCSGCWESRRRHLARHVAATILPPPCRHTTLGDQDALTQPLCSSNSGLSPLLCQLVLCRDFPTYDGNKSPYNPDIYLTALSVLISGQTLLLRWSYSTLQYSSLQLAQPDSHRSSRHPPLRFSINLLNFIKTYFQPLLWVQPLQSLHSWTSLSGQAKESDLHVCENCSFCSIVKP